MISQYGQDLFVLEALSMLRGGFFLDSGASNGVKFSNTLFLEQSFGWNGICVEPNDFLFADLIANRSCHCLNACLYDREGEEPFVEQAFVLGGILREYDPAHLRYARSSYNLAMDARGQPPLVTKQTRTIRAVLQEFGAPPVIDYWSLDTEGSELTLLKDFPFGEYTLRVVTVEHNWLPIRAEICDFLGSRGYVRVKELGCDDCYVRQEDVRPFAASAWRSPWRSATLGRS